MKIFNYIENRSILTFRKLPKKNMVYNLNNTCTCISNFKSVNLLYREKRENSQVILGTI